MPNRFPLVTCWPKLYLMVAPSGKETGEKGHVYGVSQPSNNEDEGVEGSLVKKIITRDKTRELFSLSEKMYLIFF